MQDPELVTQLKERLPETLFEKFNGSLSIDQERLKLAEYKVRVLEEKLRLVRIDKYGPGSEKLSDAQLELLDLEPGVSSAEVQAEGDRGQLKLPLKRVQKHPGRQELPADLPRVEQLIACTAQQCICGNCGRETTQIGYETAEQLDVQPAKYFVRVTKREKRACKVCEEQGVQSAPLPPRIIEKGLASDRVVIDTVVSKYADHQPLYRQSAILERETGIEVSRATLDGWVMRVGELLRPISAAMGQELLDGSYIQADETTVGVQMHDGRGKNHQAYLWQYSHPAGPVVFDFRLGREREGPKRFLGNFEGLLQSDGYGASELELSNNLAENAMRPVALGRRNWIHVGSQEAGPRVAAIISIVETCRRLSLPLRDYLSSVLPGLADFPSNRVPELTPNAWAARI